MATKKSSTTTKKSPAKKPASKASSKTAAKRTTAQNDKFRTGVIIAIIALGAIEAISLPFIIHAFVKSETPALEAPATGDVEIVTDQADQADQAEEEPAEENAAANTEKVEAAATSSPEPGTYVAPTPKPATTTTTTTVTKQSTTSTKSTKSTAKSTKNTDETYTESESRPDYTVPETKSSDPDPAE